MKPARLAFGVVSASLGIVATSACSAAGDGGGREAGIGGIGTGANGNAGRAGSAAGGSGGSGAGGSGASSSGGSSTGGSGLGGSSAGGGSAGASGAGGSSAGAGAPGVGGSGSFGTGGTGSGGEAGRGFEVGGAGPGGSGGCAPGMVCKPGAVRWCDSGGFDFSKSVCSASGQWGACQTSPPPPGWCEPPGNFSPELCCPPLKLCCQDNPGGPFIDFGSGACAATQC